MSTNYTLSYNSDSSSMPRFGGQGGWPSFYSFFPDFMIGMNSFFYSFKGGNLFRHNTSSLRNTYYGVFTASSITSVFNPEPTLSIKLFKTLSYESTTTVTDTNEARWECTSLQTDLTDGVPGSMLETYFVQKEGEWFSFLRTNAGTVNWQMRSANGVGVCTAVSGAAGNMLIEFAGAIGSILNIGDNVYAATLASGVATTDPIFVGQVTFKTSTSITVDTTVPGGSTPTVGQFIMFIKNAVAESHGARGYFLEFTLMNDSTSPVELFSVGSSVMKSFP
jgi:hypothetical protein